MPCACSHSDPAEAPLPVILNHCFFKQAAGFFFSSLSRTDAARNFDKLPISIHCTNKKENEKNSNYALRNSNGN